MTKKAVTKFPVRFGPSVQGPDGYWRRENTPCPFGVRDLTSDECYSGSGRNRCPHFVRYENGDTIVCGHPPKQEPTLFD